MAGRRRPAQRTRCFTGCSSTTARSIVSYGEFARVADRVVLSIPLGDPAESPALQLISIPEVSVDWERTDRYSDAVRAKRYGETRGENDFAMLSARVTEALNQIALTSDPARRLAMAVEARGNLARWPYRELRLPGRRCRAARRHARRGDFGAAGRGRAVELRRQPGRQRDGVAPGGTAACARFPRNDGAGGRGGRRHAGADRAHLACSMPSRRRCRNRHAQEDGRRRFTCAHRRISPASCASTSRTAIFRRRRSRLATTRAARGDVPGVQALVQSGAESRRSTGPPPAAGDVRAAAASLDLRLDEARRAASRPRRVDRATGFVQGVPGRDRIGDRGTACIDVHSSKAFVQLAGPEPRLLPRLEQRLVMARQQLAAITPPPELQPVHALFTSAFQMATRAAATARRNAVSSGNMTLAWEASSAAAGALLLFQNASEELDRLTTPPSNR